MRTIDEANTREGLHTWAKKYQRNEYQDSGLGVKGLSAIFGLRGAKDLSKSDISNVHTEVIVPGTCPVQAGIRRRIGG